MDDREKAQFELENRKLALDEKRASLDFWKFFWGSVFAAIAIATIPPSFQFATAYLENTRNTAQLLLEQQNKESDRIAKQQEFRNGYIQQFLATALQQDVELRVRFAEYFANVSPEDSQGGWIKYRDSVRNSRDQLRDQINVMETELLKLQAQSNTQNGAEARHLRRKLDWVYAELGYVIRDRSVTVNPRAAHIVTNIPAAEVENVAKTWASSAKKN